MKHILFLLGCLLAAYAVSAQSDTIMQTLRYKHVANGAAVKVTVRKNQPYVYRIEEYDTVNTKYRLLWKKDGSQDSLLPQTLLSKSITHTGNSSLLFSYKTCTTTEVTDSAKGYYTRVEKGKDSLIFLSEADYKNANELYRRSLVPKDTVAYTKRLITNCGLDQLITFEFVADTVLSPVEMQLVDLKTSIEALRNEQKTYAPIGIFSLKATDITAIKYVTDSTPHYFEAAWKDIPNKETNGYWVNKPATAATEKRIYKLKFEVPNVEKTITTYPVQVRIVEVQISLVGGAIARRGLIVKLDDGKVFMNRRSPISLASFFRRTTDKLYLTTKLEDYRIQVGQFLAFTPIGLFNFPDDTHTPIVLTPKRNLDTITAGASINQLIDLTVYTDLLGLLGRLPNGLIQSELSGRFITNTSNIKNSDIVVNNFIRPHIRFSKFDSRFSQLRRVDFVDSLKNGVANDKVNRTYLNQITYLQAGVKSNLFKFGIGANQILNVNGGIDINLVNADTLFNKDISFIDIYPELEYKVNRLNNFGLDVGLRWLIQKPTGNAPFQNTNTENILQTQASLYYYPIKNLDNRVHFRFIYFNNLNSGLYNFLQFQVGWKSALFKNKDQVAR